MQVGFYDFCFFIYLLWKGEKVFHICRWLMSRRNGKRTHTHTLTLPSTIRKQQQKHALPRHLDMLFICRAVCFKQICRKKNHAHTAKQIIKWKSFRISFGRKWISSTAFGIFRAQTVDFPIENKRVCINSMFLLEINSSC